MAYFDTHAHLDDEQFDEDRDETVARAAEAGVEAILCVGITAASSRAVVRLAERHEQVYAAVGIQPNYTAEAGQSDWDAIAALADHRRVIAIGETGLDRHWDFAPLGIQREYFDRHLRLAQQRDLPVVIHCREAEPEVVEMLDEAARRGPLRGILHAFSGTESMAAHCLGLGLYVSFAGAVTYTNRKFEPLRQVASAVPADRILIETDAPYLVPHPLRGRQKRNEPAQIVHTAECLAGLRGLSLGELAALTTANARRLLRLE